MWGLVILLWAGEMLRASSSQGERVQSWVCAHSTPLSRQGHTLKQISDGQHLVTSITDARGQLVSCTLQKHPAEVWSFMSGCRVGARDVDGPELLGPAAIEHVTGPQGVKDPGLMGVVGTGFTGMVGSGGTEGSDFTKLRPASHDRELVDFASAKLACQVFLRQAGTGSPEEQAQQHPAAQGLLQRSRRGFTYPGTLWCGAGNSAESYHQLGELKETDACCREHDHCQHVIHPFTYNYGYRNLRWHTISHCTCDNEMKDCLHRVNSTASRVVGQAFFNVIQVPCFEFMYEEQCVERFWYGWCKTYSKVAVAVPQTPVLYYYGGDLIDRVPTTKTKTEITHSTSTEGSSSTARLPGTTAQPHVEPSNVTDWSLRTATSAHRTTSQPTRTTTRSLRTTSQSPRTTASTLSTTARSSRTTTSTPATTSQTSRTTTRTPIITYQPRRTKTRTPATTSQSPRTTTRTPATTTQSPRTTTRTPATSSQPRRTKIRAPATTFQPLRTTTRILGTTTRQPRTTLRQPGITVEHSPDPPSEDPTLGQVIQATEDLLKFMMTTMSPSTSTDDSIKKQRKNKKRKKGKKQHRKGKGRKGKKSLSKSGDLAPTSWVLSSTMTIPNKDLWVESLEKAQERELQRLMLDLGGKQVVFNDVLNDEPARDEVHLSNATLPSQMPTADPAKKSLATTMIMPDTVVKGLKKGRRKERNGRKRMRENSGDHVRDPVL